MRSKRLLNFLLVPGVLFVSTLHSMSQDISAEIRAEASRVGGGVASWYQARNFAPVWNGDYLGGLAQFIQSLDAHGLSPQLFQFAEWDARWRAPSTDPTSRARVEVATTQLALYAIQSVAYGFVDATQAHPKWTPINRTVTAYQFLDQALQKPAIQFAATLLQIATPQDDRYPMMIKTLARYRELDSLGGWRDLPGTASPAGPGSKYPEVKLLTSRLQAEGDLPGGTAKSKKAEIDQRTGEAIKSFQFRHGIEPDGFLGAQTMQELNTSTKVRINQLIINIDRLRWMPRAYEEAEHIEVNIAESALRLFDNRRQVTVMPVIVGVKGKHQTPIFHGNVQHLIFRPYWNVPQSIAKTEIVPKASSDPQGYMRAHNYELVKSYGAAPNDTLPVTMENLNRAASGGVLIRQTSGPDNSLGLVKFIFPNDNSVYLHDTPDHSLFERADRDFSHGCVRVSRPDELAYLLLQRNGGWSLDNVRASMQDVNTPNRKEDFSKTIPVYLMYWTSTVMSDGRVRFDQDIYGHDTVMFQKFGLN
jgi:murein L,D-transpeptidase YcbB/YkuD